MTDTFMYANWKAILKDVKASIYAEQVFCSVTTEMLLLPQFKSQASLETLHKENYETSYHRNTAAGNLIRLLNRPQVWDEMNGRLIRMTVDCFLEAREHDRRAEQALHQLKAHTEQDEAYLDQAGKWHENRKYWLKRAARKLRASIPADIWNEGAAQAQLG